jgi:hypothetical protein
MLKSSVISESSFFKNLSHYCADGVAPLGFSANQVFKGISSFLFHSRI